jgi:hypothetical protein
MGVEMAGTDVGLAAPELFLLLAVVLDVTVVVETVAVVGVVGSGEPRGSEYDSSLDVSSGTSCSLSLRFAIASNSIWKYDT